VTAGFRDFEFDLPGALLSTMIVAFDGLEGAPLTGKNVNLIPDAQGVYQLIVNEEIVYIGKTDSEAGLRKRLERHARIIQHRSNLEVSEVYFKAVRVYVFTAMDIETQLIKHYEGQSSVNWNNSGFGSNDPGRNRDMTRAKPDSFDALYPIDLEQTISLELSGEVAVSSALQAIRRALPYTLRVEKKAKHPDFEGLAVTLSGNPLSVKELLTAVVATLPAGWQATALAGRVILYKEKEDNYPAGRIIARS
jgi:hypothetical protein